VLVAFSALTLLVGQQEGHLPCKKIWGGWWRWALVSPDGVAPRRMVGMSASVGFPLHHKFQKFSSGTGSPGWSQKNGRKTVVCVCVYSCQPPVKNWRNVMEQCSTASMMTSSTLGQPVERTTVRSTQLSNRLSNSFDNRLYRVNGVLER